MSFTNADTTTRNSRRRTFLALCAALPLAIGCGGAGSEATGGSAGAPAAPASPSGASADRAQLAVVGKHAGSHELTATDAYFVKASDAYFDIYLTNQAMTSSSLAYSSVLPDGAVLVIAAIQNRDKTPIVAGTSFTFNSSANSQFTAVIKNAPSQMETLTVVDDISLGTLKITALTADELRGEIQVEKGGSSIRGEFVAKRLSG
jgi:hypothetical protein